MKISAYAHCINDCKEQIKLLEKVALRLYNERFVDLRFPGHETTPIINGIPEGWEKVDIGVPVIVFSGNALEARILQRLSPKAFGCQAP